MNGHGKEKLTPPNLYSTEVSPCSQQLLRKLEQFPPRPKIAIVCLPFPGFEGKTVFPIGALYTYAAFREHFSEGEIQFIDVHQDGLVTDEVIERVADCDAVGFSVNVFSFPQAEELINRLYQVDSNKLIFAGGSLPTALPDVFLTEIPGLDLVFIGESEKTVRDLSQVTKRDKKLEHLSGIALRGSDGSIINQGPNLPDLAVDVPDLLPDDLKEYRGSVSIAVLRGCDYHCLFCGMERRYKQLRSFPEDKFRKQLEAAVELGQTHVVLNENQFFAGERDEVEKKITILGEYHRERGLTWKLVTSPFPDVLTSETLTKLKTNGCTSIDLHIASVDGSVHKANSSFNRILKDVTVDQYITVVNTIKKVGIEVAVLLNLGLSGETPQSFQKAVEFVQKIKVGVYNPRTRWYPSSYWWIWKRTHDSNFNPLQYLREGFKKFLHQPASLKPLTTERIEQETEYALCLEYLKKRLALAVRYVQEISSTREDENSKSTYADSKTFLNTEIAHLLGDKKELISLERRVTLRSQDSQKEVSVNELPFTYHYLLSHFEEYQTEGANSYAMMRAISDTVKDYLMFIGEGDEYVTPENFSRIYNFVLEALRQNHQVIFNQYEISRSEIGGVNFAEEGLLSPEGLMAWAVWKQQAQDGSPEGKQIIELYSRNIPASLQKRKTAEVVYGQNGTVEVYLFPQAGRDPILISLNRFSGDSSLLFEYFTQTVTSGNRADITALFAYLGAMVGADFNHDTYPYFGQAYRDFFPESKNLLPSHERFGRINRVVLERNPYDGKLLLVQEAKAPQEFFVTPHGNMRFCQVDEELVIESINKIPDPDIQSQVRTWVEANIDSSSPARRPRKYNLHMFGKEDNGSCSFHCSYCFAHANYPGMEFQPMNLRYEDSYYDEDFYHYLLKESEGKSFIPVFFFAPDTDIGSIELREQSAMIMASLIRYNQLARKESLPVGRMFLVTKAGSDFLETEYKGRQAEFQGKTVKDLLASPDIHLVVATGILDERLANAWEPGAAPFSDRLCLARKYNDEVVAVTAGKQPATMLMQPFFLPYLEREKGNGSLRLTDTGIELLNRFITNVKETGIAGVSLNVLKCSERNYKRLLEVLERQGLYDLIEQLWYIIDKKEGDYVYDFSNFGRLGKDQVVDRRLSWGASKVFMKETLTRLKEAGIVAPVCNIVTTNRAIADLNAGIIYENTQGQGQDCTTVSYEFYPPKIRAMEILQNIVPYGNYLSCEQKNAMARAALELLNSNS